MNKAFYDDKLTPFEKGCVAFSFGYPKSLNPFVDECERKEWFDGWYSAHDDFHELNNGGIW